MGRDVEPLPCGALDASRQPLRWPSRSGQVAHLPQSWETGRRQHVPPANLRLHGNDVGNVGTLLFGGNALPFTLKSKVEKVLAVRSGVRLCGRGRLAGAEPGGGQVVTGIKNEFGRLTTGQPMPHQRRGAALCRLIGRWKSRWRRWRALQKPTGTKTRGQVLIFNVLLKRHAASNPRRRAGRH